MARFLGGWSESPEGEKRSWGNGIHGLLIYADTGHMSVSINKTVVKESENELEDPFDSILFYAGTYSDEGNLIRHQVPEAPNRNRVGKEMLGYAECTGNTIMLRTPKESFGRAILVGRKV